MCQTNIFTVLLFTYRKSLSKMVSITRTQKELKHYMITSLLPYNLLEICGQHLLSKYRFFNANSTHFLLTPCEFFCGFGFPFLVPVRQNVCISKVKVFLFYQNCGFSRLLQIYQKWKIDFLPCLMSQFKVKIK